MTDFNLDVTLKQAIEEFKCKDPVVISRNTDCPFDNTNRHFIVNYLGHDYIVEFPSGIISLVANKIKVPVVLQILILHYLNSAKGTELTNDKISYKELPGGNIYIEPFNKRTLQPLLKIFGNSPEKLIQAGKKLNGKPEDYGDYSITIFAFPRIPITFVIWEGDDEIPTSGTILFDSSAVDYLHTEDYAFLASFTVFELAKQLD